MMFGLPDETIETLQTSFQKYDGLQEAILYGSRAKGNYRNGSDIDITLCTDERFTDDDLLHLMRDFDDSNMPYFVDVSVYNTLVNPLLKEHIRRVGKTLWTAAPDN